MGIRDYFAQDAICPVEWPQQGTGVLRSRIWRCIFAIRARARGKDRAISSYGSQLLDRIHGSQG